MVVMDNHRHLTGFWQMLAFFGLSGCPCNCTSDLKELVYQRLWNILNGDDSTAEFEKIPAKTRGAGSRYPGANQAGFARLLEREIASTLVGERGLWSRGMTNGFSFGFRRSLRNLFC